MRVLACYILGEYPPPTGGCALAPNHLHLSRSRSPLIPAAPSAPGCRARRLGSSPALPLLARRLAANLGGQGAPAATPTMSSQTPPSTPVRGAPTGPPWPRSAERPSLGSRRPWPLTSGSHRRLHRHRSLPDSGQRRPRALQSMSRHRPRPGAATRHGSGWRCGSGLAPAGFARSSPGGFASAPRSRSRSV